MKKSRRFLESEQKTSEKTKTPLPLEEAIGVAKENATAKFDESIDIAFRLGIEPTQSDQNVRGTVMLPQGTGKDVRVVVFANGEKQKEGEEAGAEHVGGADLVEKVKKGWAEFDVAIATPDMMKDVGRLGKILGPKGLMPNPKTGTVTFDVGQAVKEFKAGKVEYRNDKSGNVHVPLGKASFESSSLMENAVAAVGAIVRARPSATKGTYLKGVVLSSTMGPGIRVDVASLRGLDR